MESQYDDQSFPTETLLSRELKDAQYTITFFYRLSPNGTENYISQIEVPVSILGNQFSETFNMTTFGLSVGVDYDFIVYVRNSSWVRSPPEHVTINW